MHSNVTKGARGFTLVELMVVVAILSVLMAIVVPAVGGTKEQSVEGQVKSDGDAVGKAVSNFNNKSIKPAFPEASLSAHVSAGGRYEDVLTVGSGTNGSNVNLFKDKATFEASSLDGTSGLRDCDAGSGDTPDCDTLDATMASPGTGALVDKRKILEFFKNTDIYDTDGSVKRVAFVPDFLNKEPNSLPLKADETKALGQVGNVFEEFLWLMKMSAPGSSQENRVVEVYRVAEALCLVGSETVATAEQCDDITAPGEVKQMTLVRVF